MNKTFLITSFLIGTLLVGCGTKSAITDPTSRDHSGDTPNQPVSQTQPPTSQPQPPQQSQPPTPADQKSPFIKNLLEYGSTTWSDAEYLEKVITTHFENVTWKEIGNVGPDQLPTPYRTWMDHNDIPKKTDIQYGYIIMVGGYEPYKTDILLDQKKVPIVYKELILYVGPGENKPQLFLRDDLYKGSYTHYEFVDSLKPYDVKAWVKDVLVPGQLKN